ncbi:hypothetical protein BT69DRAFT_1285265 [Atractiella rhizophila]|nr:hypothetical protein BT69DRAFT_1285265 [Atractiella rhizophila]
MPVLTSYDPSPVYSNTTLPTVPASAPTQAPVHDHARRYSTHAEHRLHKRDIIIDTPGGNPSACWSGYACEPYYDAGIFPGHYASCLPATTETTSTSTSPDGSTVYVVISQSQDVCGQCVCHYEGEAHSGSAAVTVIPLVTVTVTDWSSFTGGNGGSGSAAWKRTIGGTAAKLFWLGWALAIGTVGAAL